ncbi:hypothetical protein IV925_000282 [Campylobacter jejuni]|nr:hypothetical protein [Campylobacter jejuni]EGP1273131.1 hypothetical protein [Campylobacter jejuni]EHC1858915.1 hypothetical protein [Campylobacter jejuni]EHK8462559.1 hypothetical protein [Campylobacter jejuni]EHP0928029.1 hypothetical protein [Campylobacter jejuni]
MNASDVLELITALICLITEPLSTQESIKAKGESPYHLLPFLLYQKRS